MQVSFFCKTLDGKLLHGLKSLRKGLVGPEGARAKHVVNKEGASNTRAPSLLTAIVDSILRDVFQALLGQSDSLPRDAQLDTLPFSNRVAGLQACDLALPVLRSTCACTRSVNTLPEARARLLRPAGILCLSAKLRMSEEEPKPGRESVRGVL